MPWANNPEINSLRMKYNAALSAEQDCRRALVDARMQGANPSPELLEADRKARLVLEDVRAKLLAAMTNAITGTDVPEAPPSEA